MDQGLGGHSRSNRAGSCGRGNGQQLWGRGGPLQRLTLAAPVIDRSWDDGLPGIIHGCCHEAGSLQRVQISEEFIMLTQGRTSKDLVAWEVARLH